MSVARQQQKQQQTATPLTDVRLSLNSHTPYCAQHELLWTLALILTRLPLPLVDFTLRQLTTLGNGPLVIAVKRCARGWWVVGLA